MLESDAGALEGNQMRNEDGGTFDANTGGGNGRIGPGYEVDR